LRADISPLDAALGLKALQKLRPALNTAKKLSATTGLQLNKVSRLLRLADSPEVVQQGVRDGLASDADGKKDGGAADDGSAEPHRTLDLLAALEFTRLYEFLSKKGGKSKNGASSADEKTRQAIAHALKQNWGLREVQRYVDHAISEPQSRGAKKQRGRPGAPFKKTRQQLVIYFGRLDALSADQRRSLLATLQDLVRQLSTKKNQR
jgi:ParB-like chromosome segregation protein Spo0J